MEDTGVVWRRVAGRVNEGHKVASGRSAAKPYPAGTIALQIPFFRELGLDLSGYFPATLNISIAPYDFEMKAPEFAFRGVRWTELHPPEDFFFSRCRVIFRGTPRAGLVYYPDPATKARHFQPKSMLEVLTFPIEGICYGAEIELELNSAEIELRRSAEEPP